MADEESFDSEGFAGNDGFILIGRENKWDLLAEDETHETLWDIEWFEGELYLSTILFIYRLKNGGLELVDFGDYTPSSCYHLRKVHNPTRSAIYLITDAGRGSWALNFSRCF